MKKHLFILLMIMALMVSACSSQGTQQSPTQSPSLQQPQNTQVPPESLVGAWKLTAYGSAGAPTPAVKGVGAGLTFNEDGTVSGSSGCNGLGGDYSVEGDKITFGEFVSTLMACDAPIMQQEDAAHKVMNGTATYTIEGDTLTITNNNMVLMLTRGEYGTAEPSEAVSLVGAWTLTSVGSASTVSSTPA
jgi:heat shock protein HslJ